jgi:hypothetical protein
VRVRERGGSVSLSSEGKRERKRDKKKATEGDGEVIAFIAIA